jgi:hypothetical protein
MPRNRRAAKQRNGELGDAARLLVERCLACEADAVGTAWPCCAHLSEGGKRRDMEGRLNVAFTRMFRWSPPPRKPTLRSRVATPTASQARQRSRMAIPCGLASEAALQDGDPLRPRKRGSAPGWRSLAFSQARQSSTVPPWMFRPFA